MVDQDYRASALVLQIDVFSGAGELPGSLSQAQERAKDIQFASKARYNTARIAEIEDLRNALRRVLDKLPPALQSDPDVQKLAGISTRGAVALVHLINRHNTQSSDFKDYEFSRATVMDLWDFGQSDVRYSIAHPEWQSAMEVAPGIHIYDLPL
ncbi:DUF3734 domain-containing protein [Paraburkholderia sp. UYCP14C]|uniref:DUF3734 domain-containing protein n=1 Tax=Paraburkholderia sp. UYCP14C TaxID=2511130 RepID=UPI0020071AEC|nr:DUF3734 domain-containing protein [Paraburkholderia sp. UYCP14C]